jgi:hypothetical protein
MSWQAVDAAIQRRQGSPSERLTLIVLCEAVNQKRYERDEDTDVWLSQAEVAERVGVSDRQVRRALKSLQEDGAITPQGRIGQRGVRRWKVNVSAFSRRDHVFARRSGDNPRPDTSVRSRPDIDVRSRPDTSVLRNQEEGTRNKEPETENRPKPSHREEEGIEDYRQHVREEIKASLASSARESEGQVDSPEPLPSHNGDQAEGDGSPARGCVSHRDAPRAACRYCQAREAEHRAVVAA